MRLGGLTPSDTNARYTSDRITTLESGLRHGVAGRELVMRSVSGAYSQWNNIQADMLDGIGLPQIVNIGDGRIYSLDAGGAAALIRWSEPENLDRSF